MRASLLNRKLHRWGALLAALPLLVVICTGILLQLKKESDWIQPATMRGEGEVPTLDFDAALAADFGSSDDQDSAWSYTMAWEESQQEDDESDDETEAVDLLLSDPEM